MGVLAGWSAAAVLGWPPAVRWGVVVAVVAVGLLALAGSSSLGRAGVVGGVAMLGLVAGWAVGAVLRLDTVGLATLMSVVSIVVLGLLPRLALALSGLTTLDDQRSAGATVGRYEVTLAIAAAHRGLVIATAAAAACAAVAGGLLATVPGPWTLSLAATVAVVCALRARIFPLVGQVVALFAAATAIALLLLRAWAGLGDAFPVGALLVLLGIAGTALVVLSVDVPLARTGPAARRGRQAGGGRGRRRLPVGRGRRRRLRPAPGHLLTDRNRGRDRMIGGKGMDAGTLTRAIRWTVGLSVSRDVRAETLAVVRVQRPIVAGLRVAVLEARRAWARPPSRPCSRSSWRTTAPTGSSPSTPIRTVRARWPGGSAGEGCPAVRRTCACGRETRTVPGSRCA